MHQSSHPPTVVYPHLQVVMGEAVLAYPTYPMAQSLPQPLPPQPPKDAAKSDEPSAPKYIAQPRSAEPDYPEPDPESKPVLD